MVDEDEATGLEAWLALEPISSGFSSKAWADFFEHPAPRERSQALSGCVGSRRSASHRAVPPSRAVRCPDVPRSGRRLTPCASRLKPRHKLPVLARAAHLIAVETQTPNLVAAAYIVARSPRHTVRSTVTLTQSAAPSSYHNQFTHRCNRNGERKMNRRREVGNLELKNSASTQIQAAINSPTIH